MIDSCRCEFYSMGYYLRLERGDKVLMGMEVVEVTDEAPKRTFSQLAMGACYQRRVRSASGSNYLHFTCDMRYCQSLQSLPLGRIKELPIDFNPYVPKGAVYIEPSYGR